jgi:hypothetical protein
MAVTRVIHWPDVGAPNSAVAINRISVVLEDCFRSLPPLGKHVNPGPNAYSSKLWYTSDDYLSTRRLNLERSGNLFEEGGPGAGYSVALLCETNLTTQQIDVSVTVEGPTLEQIYECLILAAKFISEHLVLQTWSNWTTLP